MNRKYRSFIALLILSVTCTICLSVVMSARLMAEGTAADAAGDPHLISSQSPRLVSVAPGGDAEFTITITNTGPVEFDTITVTDALAPDCNKHIDFTPPLVPGATHSYTCERQNVTQNFLNIIQVTGFAGARPPVTHQSDAYVRVSISELRISKTHEFQDSQVVAFGGEATFNVKVTNTSGAALTVLKIDDDRMENCDFIPNPPPILLSNGTIDLECSMANIQEAMTTIISVTAKNTNTDITFVATDAAWIELLKLEAELTASATTMPEPGDVVTYTVDLTNTGSVSLTPTALETDVFGNLLDPSNPLVPAGTNTCLSAVQPLAPSGGAYQCAFEAEVNAQPPDFTLTLTATGQESGGLSMTTTVTSTITIEDVPASLELTLTADPPFIPPPGRSVDFTIHVKNTSAVDAITVTQLEDEFLGDLNGVGTCALPAENVLPGTTYSCQFSAQVTGQDGEEHTREITVDAVSDDTVPQALNAAETVTVGITRQAGGKLYLPIATDDVVEPNNHCLLAYPLIPGRQYYFLPPRQYDDTLPLDQRDLDYFSFTLDQAAKVRIDLTNFLPQFVPSPPQTSKGQLIVRGSTPNANPPCVPVISQHIITQANNQFQVANNGTLAAGRYYIQLINDGPSNVMTYYGIRVRIEIP